MRFFGLSVSVYLIDDGDYIFSPVTALPAAAVVAANNITVAVKADNAVEDILAAHAVEDDVIFLRVGRGSYKAHRISALL